MKLLLATMKHETNTFSPVPTPIERFHADGRLLVGDDAIEFYSGTGTAIGGCLDVAAAAGARVDVPVAADGWPSGPVRDEAYEELAGRVCEAVRRGGYDGILLDLHGAMVTETHDDGEGELLRRIREIDGRSPVAVSLDMHANVSPEMVSRIDILCGYQTYPHLDEKQTGLRAARMLVDTIRGKRHPTLAWGAIPMLPHVMAQSSFDQPNRGLQRRCRQIAERGALDASLFTGFPHADTRFAGLSAVVVTDDDRHLAAELRNEMLQEAWSERSNFVFAVEPLQDSVSRARNLVAGANLDKPVFLLDHYDNAASGGSMRHATVLREIVRQGLPDVVFFAMFDPDAVAEAQRAGLHQRVTVQFPETGTAGGGEPFAFEGVVTCLSNGRAFARDDERSGLLIEMGPSAVISSGSVDVVVVSMPMEPYDIACFRPFGIDPAAKRFVALKSRVHWRAAFESMAAAFIPCAGSGACTSDYNELDFQNVRRPIFPLDPDTGFVIESVA